jgi:class 3 adenylate cyclase
MNEVNLPSRDLRIDSLSELTEGIQSELEIIGLSSKAIDACMSGAGVSSGVFFLREYSTDNRLLFQFSRGIRKLRNLSPEDFIIHLEKKEISNIGEILSSEKILPYIKSDQSDFFEILNQLPYYCILSYNSIFYGILFLGQKISGDDLSIDDKKIIHTIIRTTALSIKIHFQMIELKEKIIEVNSLKDAALDISSTLELPQLSMKSYLSLRGLLHSLGGAVCISTNHDSLFQVIRADSPVASRKSVHEKFDLPKEIIDYFLKEEKKYYLFYEVPAELFSKFNQILPSLKWEEVNLIIPLVVDKKLISFFVFGSSSDGKNYSSKNLDVITAFLLQAKTSFQNAILYQKEENLRLRFQKYVPKQIVEDAFSGTDSVGDGIEKKIVILFSDIRGFTSFCENKKPGEVVVLLNEYFEFMLDAIDSTSGILDKLIGDAIMATWGIFDEKGDHIYNAASSAIKMMEALHNFNLPRPPEKQIHIGIGLHFGEVKAGNIGGTKRSDFTIIGDSVNLASRLEGVTKQYGVSIVVSEDFYYPIKDKFTFRELDRIQVKGKQEPVKIFELIG